MDDQNNNFDVEVKEEFHDQTSYEANNKVKVKEEVDEDKINFDFQTNFSCENIVIIKEEFKQELDQTNNKIEEQTNNFKKPLKKEDQFYTNMQSTVCNTEQFNTLAKNILEIEKLNTGLNYMKCPSCGKVYKNHPMLYESHVKICKKSITKSINTQQESIHPLTCSICGHEKKNKESLKKHLYYCKRKSTVQCNQCSYRTKTIASLRSHIYHHHRKNKTTAMKEPKFVCAECGRYYATRKSFCNHLHYCNNKGLDLHCNHCSFKCKSKWYLARHIEDRHFINGQFQTKDCGWLRSLECSKCRKKYKYQSSLSHHQSVCGKEPKLKCTSCSYTCSKKFNLDIHIARQHLNVSQLNNAFHNN